MDGRASQPAERTRALIVANGGRIGPCLLRRLHEEAAITIATDGAASRLLKLSITPDMVVGDFDSLRPSIRARLPETSLVHVPDQDRCDLDKAISVALERGYRNITIAGGLGKRWDHSLTTISLLVRYAHTARIRLLRGSTEITAVTDRLTLHGNVGDRLSLIAFQPVHGVTLAGVAWPLADAVLEPGSLGVSNRMTEAIAELTVREGCLIVCRHAGGGQRRP